MYVLRNALRIINEFVDKWNNNILININYERHFDAMVLEMRWLNSKKEKMGYKQIISLNYKEDLFLEELKILLNEYFNQALILNGVFDLKESDE